MKKVFTVFLAAAMAVSLMAGCGSSSAAPAAAEKAASTASAAASEVKEATTEAASKVEEAATEAASKVEEAATEAASEVKEAATEAASEVKEAAEGAAEAVKSVGADGEYVPPADYEWPEMTLTVNDYNVVGSGPVQATDLACDYIEEVTGGKIKCDRYYGGTLMESTDSFAGTAEGLADITFYLYTLNSGVSVVHNLFTAYFVREMPNMLGMMDIINNTIDAVPQFREEFIKQGLYELVACPTSGSRLEFKDADLCASVKTPDDLKGHIIQSSGYNTPAWANHEVSGMAMPPSEWYTNLERGVVDALSMNMPGCRDFGLTDVTNGYIEFGNGGGLYQSASGYFANNEAFQSWSPEVQELVVAAFRKGVRFNCERDVQATIDVTESEKAAGKFFNSIPEEEMQPWYDLGMETIELWKKDVNDMGIDADAVFDGYMAEVDNYFATH